MRDAESFFPFWLGHPNIRNRPQSATVYDIFRMMMGSEAFMPQNDQENEEGRDTVGDLPRFSKAVASEGALQDRTNRATTPPPPRPKTECKPTPIQNRTLHSVTNEKGDVADKILQEYLQGVFSKDIRRDLPIVEFIYLVYNFSPDDLPNRQVWTLPIQACLRFCLSKNEIASYDHLYRIFESLRQQLYDSPDGIKPARGRALDSRFIPLRERIPISDYASFKPDYFFSTIMDVLWRRQSWISGLSYGEIKRTSAMRDTKRPTIHEFDIKILLEEFARSKSCQKRKAPAESTSDERSHKKLRRESQSSGDAAERGPPLVEMATTPTTSKRKNLSSLPEVAGPSSKRMRSEDVPGGGDDVFSAPTESRPLSPKEIQSAKYINELMSHGIRSYGTGWLLDDSTMTLWYADRMGIVQSASFDILDEPHYLLLLVAAMLSANANDMGVCPLVKTRGKRFERYAKTTVEIDRAETDDGPVEDLKFDIVDVQRMHTEFGAVGRGTTVVPVRPIDSTAKTLRLDTDDERLVVKISWPPVTRTAEIDYIKKIRRNLQDKRPSVLKHVVEVKCFMKRTMLETQLPRAFMDIKELDRCDERQLRCMVMKRYEPLEMVKDGEEVKRIFVDVVCAHHWVFETSGVLHRDVSVGNVMFYRERNRVVGVMCDWDQALDTLDPHPEKKLVIVKPPESELKKSEGDGESLPAEPRATEHVRPRYRTGTGPFMAFDLLNEGEAPPHLYRYDLESFFWLLAWFCALFDRKTRTYKGKTPWDQNNLYAIGLYKRDFLMNATLFDSTFETSDPSFREIIDDWLRPLRRYFQRLTIDLGGIVYIRETINEAISAKATQREMDARQELELLLDKRDKAVTYKGFMSALGLNEEGLPLQ